MASENKKAKTNKRNHPGRGPNWLKETPKLKRTSFYNSRHRQQLNKNIDVEM